MMCRHNLTDEVGEVDLLQLVTILRQRGGKGKYCVYVLLSARTWESPSKPLQVSRRHFNSVYGELQ